MNSDVMTDVIPVCKTINAIKWRMLFRFSKWVAL